jgi:endonuclease/exonuclease/phosphatase family metal-dependent hydrolase
VSTFLFWNLRLKLLQRRIARVVRQHRVDVIILAECAIPEEELLGALAREGEKSFIRIPFVAFSRVRIYSSLPRKCFEPVVREEEHYAIRVLQVPQGIDILLAVAHLASPLRKKPSDLRSICAGFADDIRRAEQEMVNERTLVVGDLNVNPYHDGMLDVRGLNAVGDRHTVRRKDPRTFGRAVKMRFRMFYNPMWSHLGDATQPAGTYYYDKSNPEVDPLWNIFDQVLLRVGLLDRFQTNDLRILTSDGQASLVTADGRPDAERASDHLPVVFRLDLRKGASHG